MTTELCTCPVCGKTEPLTTPKEDMAAEMQDIFGTTDDPVIVCDNCHKFMLAVLPPEDLDKYGEGDFVPHVCLDIFRECGFDRVGFGAVLANVGERIGAMLDRLKKQLDDECHVTLEATSVDGPSATD